MDGFTEETMAATYTRTKEEKNIEKQEQVRSLICGGWLLAWDLFLYSELIRIPQEHIFRCVFTIGLVFWWKFGLSVTG